MHQKVPTKQGGPFQNFRRCPPQTAIHHAGCRWKWRGLVSAGGCAAEKSDEPVVGPILKRRSNDPC